MSCCFWIYLERDGAKCAKQTPMSDEGRKQYLMKITSKHKQAGFEIFLSDNRICYQFTGKKVIPFTEVEDETWMFIGIDIDQEKSMFSSKFTMSLLVNQNLVSKEINYMKIQADSDVSNFTLCQDLFGYVSSILVFSGSIGLNK